MHHYRRQITAAVLVLAFGVLLILLAPQGKEKVRTKPNTTFSGSAEEAQQRSTEQEARLSMISSSAYRSTRGLAPEPGLTIAVIGKQKDTEFWVAVEEGALQAAADLNELQGFTGKDRVSVLFDAPEGKEDVDEQINILDEMLGRNPGAVCIAMIDEKACEVQFDMAENNSIVIVALDSGSDSSIFAGTCATDNEEAAVLAAEKVCAAVGENGIVSIVLSDNSSQTARLREEAIRREIKENHPDIAIGSVTYLSKVEEEDRLAKAQDLLRKPGRKGRACIACDDSSLNFLLEGQEDLLADGISTAQIFGFDGGSGDLELIRQGEMGGFILQNPYGMGYSAVVAAVRASTGAPNQSFVETGYIWVDESNYDSEEVKLLVY